MRRSDLGGQGVDGPVGMLAGEIPVQPGTVHETNLGPSADLLLEGARIDLAWLQRYAPQMAACHDGQMYLTIIAEMAEHALLFALARFAPAAA